MSARTPTTEQLIRPKFDYSGDGRYRGTRPRPRRLLRLQQVDRWYLTPLGRFEAFRQKYGVKP